MNYRKKLLAVLVLGSLFFSMLLLRRPRTDKALRATSDQPQARLKSALLKMVSEAQQVEAKFRSAASLLTKEQIAVDSLSEAFQGAIKAIRNAETVAKKEGKLIPFLEPAAVYLNQGIVPEELLLLPEKPSLAKESMISVFVELASARRELCEEAQKTKGPLASMLKAAAKEVEATEELLTEKLAAAAIRAAAEEAHSAAIAFSSAIPPAKESLAAAFNAAYNLWAAVDNVNIAALGGDPCSGSETAEIVHHQKESLVMAEMFDGTAERLRQTDAKLIVETEALIPAFEAAANFERAFQAVRIAASQAEISDN